MQVAKAVVSLLIAVLAAILPAITSDGMSLGGWINVGILGLGALQVFNASNDIPGWPYAKLIAAVLSAGLVAFTSFVSLGVTLAEWLQIGAAMLGAALVWLTPNSASTGRHARPE